MAASRNVRLVFAICVCVVLCTAVGVSRASARSFSVAQALDGCASGASSNFNGTSVAAGRYIWFSSVLKLNGTVPSGTFTISFKGQTITFKDGTTLHVPDSTVTFSSTATSASTTFSGGMWQTVTPKTLSGNTFLSGFTYLNPSSRVGDSLTNPVLWNGTFTSSVPGVSLNWQWAAAVYKTFNTDYTQLGVKATDDNSHNAYLNSDHAGTPENYAHIANNVIGGATGGGGGNFTGSYSGTCSFTPPLTTTGAIGTVASGPISLGAGHTIHDTATLSGVNANAGGSITFNAYGPNNTTCAGSPAFTSTVTVSGPNSYASANFTPSAAGTYRWVAGYSGDPGDAALSTNCNDAHESSVVDSTPPACVLTNTILGPPKQILVSVQDAESGLASIVVNSKTNATVTWPTFTSGTTSTIIVTGTKIDQTKSSFVSITVTDTAGLATTCDPVVPAVKTTHKAVTPRASRRATGALAFAVSATRLPFGSPAGLTLSGRVPSKLPRQTVTVLTQACGFTASAPLATVKTTAGGVFHYRVQPAIGATFAVRWQTMTSRTIRVAVAPTVTLHRISAGHYRVDVTTTNGLFLVGTKVVLQSASGGAWKTRAETSLVKSSSVDQITAVSSGRLVWRGSASTLRASLPATACYARSSSASIAS